MQPRVLRLRAVAPYDGVAAGARRTADYIFLVANNVFLCCDGCRQRFISLGEADRLAASDSKSGMKGLEQPVHNDHGDEMGLEAVHLEGVARCGELDLHPERHEEAEGLRCGGEERNNDV